MWQDESNQVDKWKRVQRRTRERQKSIGKKKKSYSTRVYNVTEGESSKSSDPFSLQSRDEKEKLLLYMAKIFQFPLYTAYKQ